jgi:hypothetical protein
MNSTLTLSRAIINQRLVFCALLMVCAFSLASLYSLGNAIVRAGSWQQVFSTKAKPSASTKHPVRSRSRKSAQPHPVPNHTPAQIYLVQNSLVKTANSLEVQTALVALIVSLMICCYLGLYLSVPAAVRYRLRTYLKRLFAKWAARKRAEILSQDTRLGDLLVACKVITQEELDKSIQDGDSQKGIEMMVHLGQISEHQLQSALAIQTRLQKRGSRKEKAFAWLSPDGREERQDQKAARTEAISRLRTHI